MVFPKFTEKARVRITAFAFGLQDLAKLLVRTVREAAGMTQEQLGQKIGSNQGAIARIESGRMRPRTQTLERIAKATGQRLVVDFEPVEGFVGKSDVGQDRQ